VWNCKQCAWANVRADSNCVRCGASLRGSGFDKKPIWQSLPGGYTPTADHRSKLESATGLTFEIVVSIIIFNSEEAIFGLSPQTRRREYFFYYCNLRQLDFWQCFADEIISLARKTEIELQNSQSLFRRFLSTVWFTGRKRRYPFLKVEFESYLYERFEASTTDELEEVWRALFQVFEDLGIIDFLGFLETEMDTFLQNEKRKFHRKRREDERALNSRKQLIQFGQYYSQYLNSQDVWEPQPGMLEPFVKEREAERARRASRYKNSRGHWVYR